MSIDKVTIKIPRPLYERIRTVTEESGFSSPTDFIVFVLRDLMSSRENTAQPEQPTEEEIQAVRNKLRGLGYL